MLQHLSWLAASNPQRGERIILTLHPAGSLITALATALITLIGEKMTTANSPLGCPSAHQEKEIDID